MEKEETTLTGKRSTTTAPRSSDKGAPGQSTIAGGSLLYKICEGNPILDLRQGARPLSLRLIGSITLIKYRSVISSIILAA
jgi:hypothetical protein